MHFSRRKLILGHTHKVSPDYMLIGKYTDIKIKDPRFLVTWRQIAMKRPVNEASRFP